MAFLADEAVMDWVESIGKVLGYSMHCYLMELSHLLVCKKAGGC